MRFEVCHSCLVRSIRRRFDILKPRSMPSGIYISKSISSHLYKHSSSNYRNLHIPTFRQKG